MKLIVKTYDELTKKELYEIIKARLQIFVEEQKCLYQDLDGLDYKAYHFFFMDKHVYAYLRAYEKGSNIHLGRVLTIEHNKGYGKELMLDSINYIKNMGKYKKVVLNAQEYAIPFYEKFGFKVVSGTFYEVEIPHKTMELEI